jgi:hypothetical protein
MGLLFNQIAAGREIVIVTYANSSIKKELFIETIKKQEAKNHSEGK